MIGRARNCILHFRRRVLFKNPLAQDWLKEIRAKWTDNRGEDTGIMIRKLKSGEYRLYSRKRNPDTGARRNLGTFENLEAARRHERQVQFFKRH
jgi:hypothetical protein